MLYLAPLPIASAGLVAFLWWQLGRLPLTGDRWSWTPFAAATALFTLAYGGWPIHSTLCRAGEDYDLRGGVSAGKPVHHSNWHVVRLTCDFGIHRAVLLYFPRQSDCTTLRLIRVLALMFEKRAARLCAPPFFASLRSQRFHSTCASIMSTRVA